jgi:hypothetical protein
MKTLEIFGNEVPIRALFFLGLGILCGILFFLSSTIESEFFLRFGPWFRAFSVIFILIYSILFGIFTNFSNPPLCVFDISFYILGGIICFAIFLIIKGIILLGVGLSLLVKFICTWGFLFHLYI